MTLPPVKRRKRCTDQGQAGKETHAGVGKIHALRQDYIRLAFLKKFCSEHR